MSKHTLTHADEIFAGAGVAFTQNDARRGIVIALTHRQILSNAIIGDVNGLVIAAVTPVGNVPLDGVLQTAGVANLDVARGVLVDSSNAGDTTQVVTVTGTDIAGEPLVEDITLDGTTAVPGLKAFKTVTAISVDVILAGNLTVGTTDVLGLDVRFLNIFDRLHTLIASTGAADAGTMIPADQTSPVTNTTGDRRGTYDPAVALDGVEDIVLYYVGDLTADGYGNNARN